MIDIGTIQHVKLNIYQGLPSNLDITWACGCTLTCNNRTCNPVAAAFCDTHTHACMEMISPPQEIS
jgi:hypothetical protein